VELKQFMKKNLKSRCQGITLIEILLVLGLLGIIVSFAAPAISNATAKAEIQAAAENIQYSIRIARNTARMTESNVSMNILAGPDSGNQRITFSVANSAANAPGRPGLQEYPLDGDFILVSDFPSYEFDGRGIVRNPGLIILAARDDKSLTMNFTVE
jgi:prepilin-type N-terminal cleavage/methylation domain-containing protein